MARAGAELAAAGDEEEAAPLVPGGARRAAAGAPRDVHLLSAAFLFVFLAYHAAQNLQSTVNTVRPDPIQQATSAPARPAGRPAVAATRAHVRGRRVSQDENLGSMSLGVLYTSFTAFAAVGSAVVRRMGSRRALVVGTSGYLLFIAANLAPTWYAHLASLCSSANCNAAAHVLAAVRFPPSGNLGCLLPHDDHLIRAPESS
ncbi:hypothetical protein ACP70R_033446 [Stipagrostis hirtigluma subsp. patula]